MDKIWYPLKRDDDDDDDKGDDEPSKPRKGGRSDRECIFSYSPILDGTCPAAALTVGIDASCMNIARSIRLGRNVDFTPLTTLTALGCKHSAGLSWF